MRRIATILFLWLSCFTAGAFEEKDITVKNISTGDGLSHHSVNTIYQDEFGFIWIGTLDGLNRYDGHRFKVFKPSEDQPGSISENNIRHICGDGKGHLFIKGLNSLSEFDMKTQQFRLMAKDGVKALFYDGTDLWISDTQTLYVYDRSKDDFVTRFIFSEKGMPEVVIMGFIIGHGGRQYVSTRDNGVFVINDRGNIVSHINVTNPSSLLEDRNGNLWIATLDNGIWLVMRDGQMRHFSHKGHHRESTAYNNVREMCEDKDGNIWMCTYGGLVKIDADTMKMVHYKYDFDQEAYNIRSISSILYDSQGSLWLGSFHNGVCVYNPDFDIYSNYQAKRDVKGRLSSPVISCIAEDDNGRLFIGTEGEWVNVLDLNTRVFSRPSMPELLHDHTVKSMLYSRQDGVLYVANLFGGITSMDFSTGRRKVYAGQARMSNVVAMQEYGRDTIFLGTNEGIKVFNKKSGKTTLFESGFKSDYVKQIWDMETDGDNLWFTTSSDLYCYNVINKVTRCYALGDLLGCSINNHFNSILKDSKGRLWFGSSGSGFFLYDRAADNFRRFGVEDGMPSGFVTALCEDVSSGMIYVATNKGLVSYNPDNDVLISYDSSSNFPVTFIRGMFITKDGELFVCDLDGMKSVSCADLVGQPRDYEVFVSGLMVDNVPCVPKKGEVLEEDVLFQKEVLLSPHHSSISFEITSTDYLNISDFAAEYKLDGFDSDFITTSGQYNITYTNLSPGKYTFIVKGLTPDRKGEYPISSISVIVDKPFYLTAWFIILVLIFVGAFVMYLVRVYAMSVKLRSLNTANESKMRFFTNISHEFRTPLTLINGQLEILLQQDSLKPSVYSRILSIYRNAMTMNNLVNEIVDMMKSEAGKLRLRVVKRDIVAFIREIYVTFNEYARQKNIELTFSSEVESASVAFDGRQLEKVFFNLLSNAFKYTPSGGGIDISVKKVAGGVSVSVTDTGLGISPEHIGHIFEMFYQDGKLNASLPGLGSGIGLSLSKAIVEMHGGTISVESVPDRGTCFTVVLKSDPEFSDDVVKVGDVYSDETLPVYEEPLSSEPDADKYVSGSRGIKMLIVEDSREIMDLLVSVFSPVYDVFTASCGEEGLALAGKEAPDIIVSDVMMPGMSGIEMCRILKDNLETCHIPIVLLTAYALENYVVEGFSMGADDYMTKPFNVKILMARCENLIRGRRRLQDKYLNRPETPVSILSNNSKDKTMLEKAVAIVMEHIDDPDFRIDVFAHELGLSRTYLFSKIKGLTGQSPNEFITTIRLKEAVARLVNSKDESISDIAYSLGFSSSSYFINCFKARYGKTPAQYRKEFA